MVRAYIWLPQTNEIDDWGHAALEVNSSYFSFWPKDRNKKKFFKTPILYALGKRAVEWATDSSKDDLFSVTTSYEEDISEMEYEANDIITIHGLNEAAMEKEIQSYLTTTYMSYGAASVNCANFVISNLIFGYAQLGTWYYHKLVLWPPSNIFLFSRYDPRTSLYQHPTPRKAQKIAKKIKEKVERK